MCIIWDYFVLDKQKYIFVASIFWKICSQKFDVKRCSCLYIVPACSRYIWYSVRMIEWTSQWNTQPLAFVTHPCIFSSKLRHISTSQINFHKRNIRIFYTQNYSQGCHQKLSLLRYALVLKLAILGSSYQHIPRTRSAGKKIHRKSKLSFWNIPN